MCRFIRAILLFVHNQYMFNIENAQVTNGLSYKFSYLANVFAVRFLTFTTLTRATSSNLGYG